MRVIVIGAGLAGLTIAYELGKLGYEVQVLEARARPGGRAHTIRRGTVSEEDGAVADVRVRRGAVLQLRRDAHRRITTRPRSGYCRELQVPVETFSRRSDAAYLYQQKTDALAGRRVRLREVRTDLNGYVVRAAEQGRVRQGARPGRVDA